MERLLIISDQLNPVSATGDCHRRAKDRRAAGFQVELTGLGAGTKRISPEPLLALKKSITDWKPDLIECWGERSIFNGGILKPFCQPGIQWTAVHNSTDRLLHQHVEWFRKLSWQHYDRHLIRNEQMIGQVRSRFPKWKVDTLPWMHLGSDSKTIVPGGQQTSNVTGINEDRKTVLQRQLGLPDHSILIGTCGDLIPQNRIKDFIWAADLMTCIRDDVYWLVLGEGPERNRLGRFADHLQVGQHLRFLGLPEDANKILAGLHIYVQPSTYQDGNTPMMAALGHRIPVVATSQPAHRKLIHHGINGYVVERGARNELARCVNRLVNSGGISATSEQRPAAA